MKRSFLCLTAMMAITSAFGQAPTAKELLDSAAKQAKQKKKGVLVVFHASWCGWCKKLDAFIARPDIQPIFDKYVVITHLDVLESENNKALENEGAGALLEKSGAAKAGIPFTLAYDFKGKLTGDSFYTFKGQKQNIGYPAEPQEIEAFISLLKKANASIKAEDIAFLTKELTTASKALNHG